jgi:proteasome lid subunit RPN8/RPN11
MIEIRQRIINNIKNHALKDAPKEACGILVGKNSKVEEIYECKNSSESPETNYVIAPSDLLTTLEDLEKESNDIIGFYHSHPTGPDKPSSIDIDRATWEDHSYVIVSISDKLSISSWKFQRETNKFAREEIKII